MATFEPNVERWRSLVAKYFPADQVEMALAVVQLESHGNPGALNDRGEYSRGLFQVNTGPGANTDLASWNLYDPETNVRAARLVWDRARGWSPWSTASAAASLVGGRGIPIPVPGMGTAPGVALVPGSAGQPATVVQTEPIPSFGGVGASLEGIAAGVAKAGQSVVEIPATIAAASAAWLTSATSFLSWLGQTNIYERLGLVVLGGILVVIGLVLFALSFVPKGTPVPVPV